ncbi:MAG: mercury(II) reductase [Alphaproteobacteria bacterium]|jgi:mercuric reductase|nr:mercury(II) reductase [Nitrobacter sp. 62-23]MBK5654019.1 mercury(II) reductase [Rhizobium sp.]MBN9499627.1 mercury(II) reductase [Alphaproteobacteria bacterium]OJV00542.1 MAG: mercury(II) reductase [Nitrobacter sp. 62-23]
MTDSRNPSANNGNGRYDLIVVGAGSAGFSAAITAAEQGAQVALVGHGTIGGTCVNFGCVPSKTLIRATEAVHHANIASTRFDGIESGARVTDWAAQVAQKDALVASLRQAKYADLLSEYNNVAYHEGRARLVEGGVDVGARLLASERIIIATGARPALPSIPGIGEVSPLDSTMALALTELPRSLIVMGGGYVGAELAQTFARAGVAVTLVFRSRLLPEAEPEIGQALADYLTDEGVTIVRGVTYDFVRKTDDGGVALAITRNGGLEVLTAEQILVATGRTPNTQGLGLSEAGVAQTSSGAVVIDDRMGTSKAGVYAAGDVTGKDQFVYMAAYGAKLAARNALNGNSLRYDNTVMPAVVFTDPQVASVGVTEAQARAAGHAVRTSVLSLDNVPRALAARDTRGLIKLVADGATRKLLGAHILSPEGADSIQTAALAIRCGLSIDDLAEMIFPYLTTVEGLKLAAQTFDRDVKKLSCCAG